MAEQSGKNGKVVKIISMITGFIVIGVFLWAIVSDYFNKSSQVMANSKTASENSIMLQIQTHNLKNLMRSQGLIWEVPLELQIKLNNLQ